MEQFLMKFSFSLSLSLSPRPLPFDGNTPYFDSRVDGRHWGEGERPGTTLNPKP